MKVVPSAMLALAVVIVTCGATAAAIVAEGDVVTSSGPAIPVITLKGDTVDLRGALARPAAGTEARGAATVLVFWATWCKPCLHEVPEIRGVGRFYASQGLRVLSVALPVADDTPQKVAETAKENGIDYEVLYDQNGSAHQAFGVESLPTSLLIDGKGVVRWRGSAFPRDINARIKAILEPGSQSGAK